MMGNVTRQHLLRSSLSGAASLTVRDRARAADVAAVGGIQVPTSASLFSLNGFLVSNRAFDAGFTCFVQMGGRRIAMTTAFSNLFNFSLLPGKHA
jgi:hypothetical protein